jgi:ribosomal protein S6
MEDKKDLNLNTDNELKVYELGYSLLPILAEENLGEEVSKIKNIIEKNGGLFIGEEGMPKTVRLSYEMSKVIDNKKNVFNTAYFGWVKFEAETSSIKNIEEELKSLKNVLRFILIKSVRESKMISPKISSRLSTKTPKVENQKAEGPISEVEVDQAIEELVLE